MSWDTQYRPITYDQVLAQDASIAVVQQLVQDGAGFEQSYLFCGPHGCGKTTLGRILGRALLCEAPVGGNPCDECPTCIDILTKGHSECFTELDAASKSGKADILRIIAEIGYSTFSGKRRLYLFDEAHQLTKGAVTALLKAMEDEVPGSRDKQIICIFCTTEPEKMIPTVFSRCAPRFTIRTATPEAIAGRVALICGEEGVEYEEEALVLLAEINECHIRDVLMAAAAISKLGPITVESVKKYLVLDTNDALLKILILIGNNLDAAMLVVDELKEVMSPTTCYERLADLSMLAYKVHLGVGKVPRHLKKRWLKKIGDHHHEFLVTFADTFASRPGRPRYAMLTLDIARLHQLRTGTMPQVLVESTVRVSSNGTSAPADETRPTLAGNVGSQTPSVDGGAALAHTTPTGVYVEPRAVNNGEKRGINDKAQSADAPNPRTFRQALRGRVAELRDSEGGGPEGRVDLGGAGTYPTG